MEKKQNDQEMTVLESSVLIMVISMIILGILGAFYTPFGFWKSALILGIGSGVVLTLVNWLYCYITKNKDHDHNVLMSAMLSTLLISMVVLGLLGAIGSIGFLKGASTNGLVVGVILCVVVHYMHEAAMSSPKGKWYQTALRVGVIWIGIGGVFLMMVFGVGFATEEKRTRIQHEREYAALDNGLKQYFHDKIAELSKGYSTITDSLNSGKDLEGKFIGIVRNEDNGSTALEFRLNEELKKHSQYTANPDSLDYVVVLLPYWSTDYYGRGSDSSCSTEMATAYILDYKTDSIVKIIRFDTDKNPYSIKVRRYHDSNRRIPLKGEELYNGIMKTRTEVEDYSD